MHFDDGGGSYDAWFDHKVASRGKVSVIQRATAVTTEVELRVHSEILGLVFHELKINYFIG